MSNEKIICCRLRQTKNKIPIRTVFETLPRAKCGKCHEALFLDAHAAFAHLTSKAYEHPFDTKALENIKKVPGIDSVLKTLIKESYERAN